MKWPKIFFCLAALVAGAAVGRWVIGAEMAEREVRQSWAQKDDAACLQALLRLADLSPARAYDLLLSLNGPEVQTLMQDLVKNRPQTAGALMTVFLRHPEHHHHQGMVASTVFRACARAEPERAWQELMAQKARFMPGLLTAVAQGMAQRDPVAAMAFAEKITAAGQREPFVEQVLEEWSGSAKGEQLLQWLRTRSDSRKLAGKVPWLRLRLTQAAALQDLAALLPEDEVETSMNPALTHGPELEDPWVRHTDWLRALPAGGTRTRLCALAATGLAGLDPDAALTLLPEIKDAHVHQLVTSAAAAHRTAVAPQEGLAFANALTDAEERRKARNAVFLTWAENDPPAAVRHALESGDSEASLMLQSGAYAWARLDPEGACRFALEQDQKQAAKPEGSSQRVLTAALTMWARAEPVAAARWVKALPESPQRDHALAALASALASRAPEEGLGWAQAIADAEARAQSLRECLRIWLYKDPDKPLKWLEQSQVDAATKASLENSLKPMRQNIHRGSFVTNLSDGTVVIH